MLPRVAVGEAELAPRPREDVHVLRPGKRRVGRLRAVRVVVAGGDEHRRAARDLEGAHRELVVRRDEDDGDVAASIVELVENGEPGSCVAVDQRVEKSVDSLTVGQAEKVADLPFVDAATGGPEELVEHRLGVAHPARGKSGDEMDRGAICGSTVGLEDPRQLALDLGDRQPANVVALDARQDRKALVRAPIVDDDDDEDLDQREAAGQIGAPLAPL